MNRHPIRWDSLIFGILFAAFVANWAVWKQDVLSPRELSLAASAVLIGVGLLVVVATLWRSRPAPAPAGGEPVDDLVEEREAQHEEADPKP